MRRLPDPLFNYADPAERHLGEVLGFVIREDGAGRAERIQLRYSPLGAGPVVTRIVPETPQALRLFELAKSWQVTLIRLSAEATKLRADRDLLRGLPGNRGARPRN